MAPASHGGELLGLIVVERPAAADSFSDDDDRVLTELARQVGLAFHNAQLDTALQTTLDELRGQAEALRESAPALSPAATPSAAGWSATCTTEPSRISSRWRSTCG